MTSSSRRRSGWTPRRRRWRRSRRNSSGNRRIVIRQPSRCRRIGVGRRSASPNQSDIRRRRRSTELLSLRATLNDSRHLRSSRWRSPTPILVLHTAMMLRTITKVGLVIQYSPTIRVPSLGFHRQRQVDRGFRRVERFSKVDAAVRLARPEVRVGLVVVELANRHRRSRGRGVVRSVFG